MDAFGPIIFHIHRATPKPKKGKVDEEFGAEMREESAQALAPPCLTRFAFALSVWPQEIDKAADGLLANVGW